MQNFHTGVQKTNLEGMFGNRPLLPDDLIKTLLNYNTFAGGNDIDAGSLPGAVSPKVTGIRTGFPSTPDEHKVQISRVKSIDDGAVG